MDMGTGVRLLPHGWDVPGSLPVGITVAPAADPESAARAIAERVHGRVVADVAGAERALASQAARARAEVTVIEAALATRLAALVEGSDQGADRALLAEAPLLDRLVDAADRAAGLEGLAAQDEHELRAAAESLRQAAAAYAAVADVGERPNPTPAEIELLRARSLAGTAEDEAARAAEATKGSRNRVGGALAAAAGAALVLGASSILPVEAVTALPVGGLALSGAHERRLRRIAAAAGAAVDRARGEARHAQDDVARLHEAELAWARRMAAAEHAAEVLQAARDRWSAASGDGVSPEDVELRCAAIARAKLAVARVAEAREGAGGVHPDEARIRLSRVGAAAKREDARRQLHEILHGRRLDRLQADAAAARSILRQPSPAIVLCDPFSSIGPGRRRALLRDLERAADVVLAVVTADEEALGWAEAKGRASLTTAAR